MFFRKKKSPHSNKPVLQLVENTRENNKVRQKIIISLGTNFPLPDNLRKEVAEAVEQKLLGQTSLFFSGEVVEYAEKIIKKIQTDGKWNSQRKQAVPLQQTNQDYQVAEVFVDGVEHGLDRILGPLLIGDTFWKRTGFPEVLSSCGFSQAEQNNAEITILNRLIAGSSENAIPLWIRTTASADIIERNAEEYSSDRFYRISDKLLKSHKRIEEGLYKKASTLFGLDNAVYLYDLTNTYFEGGCKGNPKAEYKGNQKEKRNDCPQVVVALVLDREGFVRKHLTFNGKMSDTGSLEIILEKLEEEMLEKEMPTIIFDRGVASKDNLELIESKQLKYIVATRSSEESLLAEDFSNREFRKLRKEKTKNEVEISLKQEEDIVYLLCKSKGRRAKEESMRNQAEEKLEDAMQKLEKLVNEGKKNDPAAVERAIGRIKEKHSKAAQFYEIEYIPFTFQYENDTTDRRKSNSLKKLKEKSDSFAISYIKVEKELKRLTEKYGNITAKIERPRLEWEPLDEKIEKRIQLEGNYLLKTNRKDLTDDQIWNTYMMLTLVEKAFRNLKSDLGLRPNYHQKEKRVDGHIFITILAYHLLHSIEYTLRMKGFYRCWDTIKRVVSTHTYSTIILPTTKGAVIHLRKPGIPEDVHTKIYDLLSIDYKNLPNTKIIA